MYAVNILFNGWHGLQRQPSPSVEKPPDRGSSPLSNTQTNEIPKISFRDMVLGDKQTPPVLPRRDLITEKLMIVT